MTKQYEHEPYSGWGKVYCHKVGKAEYWILHVLVAGSAPQLCVLANIYWGTPAPSLYLG